MKTSFFSLSLLVSLVASIPVAPPTPSPTLAVSAPLQTGPLGIQIHGSCSAVQTNQLLAGLKDTETFTSAALSHLHTHGRSSPIFKKYFGDSPTAEVIGWFSRILYAAKPGALFRCDDIDGNCANDSTWAGHHRGSNATSETVICPPSYTLRLSLTQMCSRDYTVAGNKTNIFWASDLMHRLLHVPGVSEDAVLHYSDGYEQVLEWAKIKDESKVGGKTGVWNEKEEVAKRTGNSDGLIYFALEVYATDVAVPGVGCTGEVKVEKKEEPKKDEPKKDGKECHFHDDGTEHCT